MTLKKYIAEAFGTFALVFCGTGAMTIDEVSNGAVSHVGIAITFGLIVMAMIFTLGEVSGAHLNPVVSIIFTINKTFEARQLLPYIVSQLAGAFVASIFLKYLFPTSLTLGATLPSGTVIQSFIVEIILTAILVMVILQVSINAKEKGIIAGLAIGGVVLLEAMFAGPISGASMNPARSIAPAIISGNTQHLWVYIVAPLTGAFLAFIIHQIIKK